MVTQRTKCLHVRKDRISELPDEILCSLLLLLPMREAVRTSILSPRWRHLSKTFLIYSSSLNLDASAMRGTDYPPGFFGTFVDNRSTRVLFAESSIFAQWVDQILKWDYRNVINSFRLRYFLTKDFAHHIDGWIDIAISKRLQNFELDLTKSHTGQPSSQQRLYVFPHWLFTGSTTSPIRVFILKSCKLGPLDPSGFSSLLELRLHSVLIDRISLENFLSNCPNLEKIFLIYCLELHSLEIMDPFLKLKYLTIATRSSSMRYLKIGARNLIRLEYMGNTDAISFSNLCQLSQVIIHPYPRSDVTSATFTNIFEKLSTQLPKLESLMLLARLIPTPLVPSQLKNLKKLNLIVTTRDGILWGFIPLLHASPYLETLEFHWYHMGMYRHDELASSVLEWSQRKPSDSPHYHLKNVVLGGFACRNHEIEVAKYILKNARSLEKITIDKKAKDYNFRRGIFIPQISKRPLLEDPDEERKLNEGAKQQLLDVLTPGVELLFM